MARRRPRHGQNPHARSYMGTVLIALLLLITGAMFFQTFGVTALKLGVAAATIVTIITWQVWSQKRRARLGAERPPAEPPGYTSAGPPQDTPPL